ncbi:hypothetical protein Hanom_Chr05g00413081 [Helianthus anomalus]
MLSSCNLYALLAEGVARFTKGMQEHEEVIKKKDKMKASMAMMKKEVDGFSKKEEAWVKKKKALDEEKEGLKASVAQASGNNQWLIEHGFHQVVTYLLHSNEFNSALGEVYTRLLDYGKHLGLIAGIKLHESDQALEQSPIERLTYLYVSQVATCFGKPLSVSQELKLAELNEKVCAKVLDSLSKKHSRLEDSEETFSEDPDVSKEASLEGSTVGDDGGSKAKKVKKDKKGKGNDSGASMPLVDV